MTSTRQGQATSPADRALLIAQVDALVRDGVPVRRACAEINLNHNNYYRWKDEAEPLQAPRIKAKRGPKTKFELTETETRRLRFWRLVKGSIPLAVEAVIAESLTCNEEPYFSALRASIGAADLVTTRVREEMVIKLRNHWQAAIAAKRPVVWPGSIQRACRVTAQEEAQFRGKKHASDARGMERRGNLIRTEEGELIPWYPGAIYESDDMSSNDPFRFHDAAAGQEMLGRQILATIDACPLFWLGSSHIGRDRDSYRSEDIASHFREIVETHGMPLIWRIEKGRWDNDFIWGCKIGTTPEGKDIRWGGLNEIINIAEKHTSQGKANVEGAFDLLQALMDHGFNGQTLSIGRERGQFEEATRQMLRANRDRPDVDALAKFWNITDSADAVQKAMHLFNTRPKRRQAWNNEMVVPAEIRQQSDRYHKPLPAEHAWRFHAVKTKATIRRGIIEVRAPHYPLSFRFRVHGGSRTPNIHCDNGHEVLVAFTPSAAWEGCHVFNADKSARNREGWGFGQRLGVAEHMADALQEDLYGKSYSPGANRAAAQVRKETRLLIAGTNFAGARVRHAQDSFGNQLTQATQAATESPRIIMSTPTTPPARSVEPPTTPAAPSRRRHDPETAAAKLHLTAPARQTIETTAPDFDEEEELKALSQH